MAPVTPDATQLERVERLTPYRIGLFVSAGVFTLLAALPWYFHVQAERKLQWKETLAMDQWRREVNGRAMMRGHLLKERGGVGAEEAIAHMNLGEDADPPQPPQPREVRMGPPAVATAAFLAAAASLVGAGAIRRQQLDEIQSIADAARAARARKAAEEEARANAEAQRPPASDVALPASVNVKTQPVMPDEPGADAASPEAG